MSGEATSVRTRVLIVTPDSLGERMAGPAIRAWQIATTLADEFDVTLASTTRADVLSNRFAVTHLEGDGLVRLAASVDVLIIQGHVLRSEPGLKLLDLPILADIYDPMHLEQLEQAKDLPAEDRLAVTMDTVEVMNDQLERADFMVCASEKQRDLWLGQLSALGRLNPITYDADNTLRTLIDLAPFGVQAEPPERGGPGIKRPGSGIGESDRVVLWGGGIYNWFDPLTVVRAIDRLRPDHADLRLYFLGAKHPNPHVPRMEMQNRVSALTDELGLRDRWVFFNESWVPFERRGDYLLDAHAGVSAHYLHVETAFSFRTRILDYIWARLPIVATEGDVLADLIERRGVGIVVPAEDVGAMAAALETVVYDDARREEMVRALDVLASEMTWPTTLQPIVEFCRAPRRAPDLVAGVLTERERIRRDQQLRIEALESSSSWRLTAPLRWITSRRRS